MGMAIDHVLIRTSRFAALKQFLARVAGLKEGARPPFQCSCAWMYSGNRLLIHLVETGRPVPGLSDYLGEPSTAPSSGEGPVDQVAFSGGDYPALVGRLQQPYAEFHERTVPQSHEHRVFAQGPEGVWLESLFVTNKGN